MGDSRRDPVSVRDDGSQDLYDIAEWEVRSWLDRVAWLCYAALVYSLRGFVVLAAIAILLSQFLVGGLGALSNPVLGAFTVLSAVPALALAAYAWHTDVTTKEPLALLVATFALGVLFASFAGIANSGLGPAVQGIGSGFLASIVGTVLFYFLVVGPVEEGVKLLSVRLVAYRSDRFDAVIDGAVYGAVAGLGFATIENALYITQNADAGVTVANAVMEAGSITFLRSLAGPGHVIYSAFAGYYLGLAKFNREHAGPIVIKGLIVASLIHATYNTLVGVVPAVVSVLTGVSPLVAFLGFVLVYDGVFGALLLGKFNAYERAYERAHTDEVPAPELTEFDP
ncbi:PrsW family intramembrane metalloprotease [Halomicrobium katesii]|uniref:PrsW family intramembrane metalloprotease n=1 Tax=Halomicrobium katesii TaxID=437163 RepID=UPI0003796430|nr:PrsW family intramembrane metalloprotease [Halomicrobium katesii]